MMMRKKTTPNPYNKRITIRLKQSEYDKLLAYFSKTPYRKLSQYVRKIILNKPVVAQIRNQSLDDMMTPLLSLKKSFAGIANNVNQAVRKLHSITEFSQMKSLYITLCLEQKTLEKELEKLDLFMAQLNARERQNIDEKKSAADLFEE